MAIFKCKMCGGDLNISADDKIVECEYCGTTQTVPSADNEKKMTLFNRANRLRLNSEFDKAAVLYEQIIAEFPEEAEAYWGLCLCNYGIEYVDDPATGKKIPTCHRASFQKLREDENFNLAMEYSDAIAQKVYRDEAREIDRINAEILSVSRNEKPYDVFICYKETDEFGGRTPDSVMAQEVYDALTDKGYKVFFSRITLEDKLGMQYEPYIFAALNSAKVMLAFGTKYEYFHAVWVKNEWNRFLKLAAKDKTKKLIPVYKDMDPYDLPDEFKALQAQDMGKLGAVQDLVRGVGKLLTEDATPVKETIVVQTSLPQNAAVIALKKRGMMALEDGEWDKADSFFEDALNQDPEDAECYLGKLMAELHVRHREELSNQSTAFSDNNLYRRAMRFASPELKQEMESYIAAIQKREEEKAKERSYQSAIQSLRAAASEADYRAVARQFSALGDYKDSAQQACLCLQKAETQRLLNKQLKGLISDAEKHIDSLQAIIDPYQKQLAEIDDEISSLKKRNKSLTLSENEMLYALQDRYIELYDAHADLLDSTEELIDRYRDFIQNVRIWLPKTVSEDVVSQLREQLQRIIDDEKENSDLSESEKPLQWTSDDARGVMGSSKKERKSEKPVKMICPNCGYETSVNPNDETENNCPSCNTPLVEDMQSVTFDVVPILPYRIQDDEIATQLEQLSPEELLEAYQDEAKNDDEYRQLCYQRMLEIGVVEKPDAGIFTAFLQSSEGSDDSEGSASRNRWTKIVAVAVIVAIVLTVIFLATRSLY